MRTKEKLFLEELFEISFKDLPLFIIDEIERYHEYLFSKRFLKANHRGKKDRWQERRAIKEGAYKNGCRFRGKPLPALNINTIDSENFSYIPIFNYGKNNSPHFIFLCKGMDVLIEKDGSVGAISFNPRYLGHRIIYTN